MATRGCPSGPSTFRRNMEPLWDLLASSIENMKSAQSVHPESEPSQLTEHEYVQRPDLEAEIQRALNEGRSPIVLWGESGNGKTWLCKKIIREHFQGRNIAIFREGDDEASLFDLDLIAELRRRGLSPESWTTTAVA